MDSFMQPSQRERLYGCGHRHERTAIAKSSGVGITEQRWILTATILGTSMAFIDGSVINIALPVLQKSLSATVTDSQWIVDAYLLVLASLLLAGGALGDHLGRMRVFAAGVAIFGGASVWCGLAPDTRHLIAARALQGVA